MLKFGRQERGLVSYLLIASLKVDLYEFLLKDCFSIDDVDS